MANYYIPVSAFIFPEVAGGEAISPTAGDVTGVFVGRSSYPTSTTGTIPVNPIKEMLVLYSAPVTWGYQDGSVMDYPLVIEIPDTWIDDKDLTELKLPSLAKGVSAWAYNRTIFFNLEEPMRYLFRTEVDKNQQLNNLLPFKDIKNLERTREVSDSFERTGLPVLELPDAIADEIRQSVSTLNVKQSRFQDDLLVETRCGACLGHAVALAQRFSSDTIKIEDCPNLPLEEKLIATAVKVFKEMNDAMKTLAQILYDGTGLQFNPFAISLKPVFKSKGRGLQRIWPNLDPVLQQCVDFIATYPRNDWNWFGNEERFVFVRELWNSILQPVIMAKAPKSLDYVRDEVVQICRHFKNPNETDFSFNDVKSPLLQAFYFALDCPREAGRQEVYLKSAHRPEFCLAVFGALRGYAYFSRTMFPDSEGPLPPIAKSPKQEPPVTSLKDSDAPSQETPSWAVKFISMLKAIFSARKITPKKEQVLMDSFCQATQEVASEDKLLAILAKKPGWSKRTKVYKDFAERISDDWPVRKKSEEMDLFEQAASMGDGVNAVSTDISFIEDPELVQCLGTFLTDTLAVERASVDALLKDARFLQKGYAPGGRYADDPERNPRDNKNTIRHYINLVAKKTSLSGVVREAIIGFLSKRYK